MCASDIRQPTRDDNLRHHIAINSQRITQWLDTLETQHKADAHTAINKFHDRGALGRNRTYDLRIRSPLLYPTELQGHGAFRM